MSNGIIFTSLIETGNSYNDFKSHLLDEHAWESFGSLLKKVLLYDYPSIYNKIIQEDIEFFHYHRIYEINSKELKILVSSIDTFFEKNEHLSEDLLVAQGIWEDFVRPDLIIDPRYYSK